MRYISTNILVRCYVALCAICILGVYAYAANTGLSPVMDSGSDGSDDHSSSGASTVTDLPEGLSNEIQNLDSPVILLQSGTIVMANDLEDPPRLSASPPGSSQVGFSVEVSSSIGNLLLVPSDYSEKSFTVDSSGHLIGIRSSTFNCFIGEYTVRFPSYSTPQYRLTNSTGYTWNDINITYVDSSNVEIIGQRFNWWSERYQVLISVATLCFILILALRRRD